jgi:hypothetical protein
VSKTLHSGASYKKKGEMQRKCSSLRDNPEKTTALLSILKIHVAIKHIYVDKIPILPKVHHRKKGYTLNSQIGIASRPTLKYAPNKTA